MAMLVQLDVPDLEQITNFDRNTGRYTAIYNDGDSEQLTPDQAVRLLRENNNEIPKHGYITGGSGAGNVFFPLQI